MSAEPTDLPVPELAAPASVLRHRAFALFWASRVFSTIAFQMQAVAIGWQVYGLTGSAFALGLVGLAQFVPALALAFVVGPVADRFDRRLIVRLCQAVEGLAIAGLAVAWFTGGLGIAPIFGAIFVIGCARAFEAPTLQALLPGLVPASLLPRALAWSSTASQSAIICGPAVGGLLYAISPGTVYAVSAGLFLVSCTLIGLIRLERVPPRREPVTLASVFAGVAFIRSRPAVLGAISLDLFAVLLGGATALLPIFARDILQIGPWGLGILRSAPALGALSMSLLLAQMPLNRKVGRIMFTAVALFGAATIVFALSTSFWLSLAALVVLGAADSISVVIRLSLVQLETPDEMRGRVSAVNFIFIGTSNQLGEFESGLTAAWFGAVPAALIGGIGTLLVVLLWMRAFPSLAQRDRLLSEPAPV
ncbi:MAG TPA: MFS transporter [Aliidongia sp.]|uniref:MFS transporter n=1 Tax=Aliidongia sp. TaxID=1914230 RepID=UPI002DDD5E28|nr:MFS transporter [Aliidongia sp.]HEV2678630.1 MFS transporter [Aliidongia sp.]